VTGDAAEAITVVLVDDQEIIRRGARVLLGQDPWISVIGEAATAEQAIVRILALRPRVAVLAVHLPDGDGVAVCREIRSRAPEVGCLMFTWSADADALFDAVMAGTAGYLLKQVRGADLVAAVHAVAEGKGLLDPESTHRMLEGLRRRAEHDRDPMLSLTDQERRILDLIGEGLTNREIARRLYLAEKTVKNYVSNLLGKLDLHRRSQAAAFAAARKVEDLRLHPVESGRPHRRGTG